MTSAIYASTTSITQYRTTEPAIACDLSQVGKHTFFVDDGRQFVVEVVDPVADYLALMEEIFDFSSIRTLLSSGKFRVLLDSMHGGECIVDRPTPTDGNLCSDWSLREAHFR